MTQGWSPVLITNSKGIKLIIRAKTHLICGSPRYHFPPQMHFLKSWIKTVELVFVVVVPNALLGETEQNCGLTAFGFESDRFFVSRGRIIASVIFFIRPFWVSMFVEVQYQLNNSFPGQLLRTRSRRRRRRLSPAKLGCLNFIRECNSSCKTLRHVRRPRFVGRNCINKAQLLR